MLTLDNLSTLRVARNFGRYELGLVSGLETQRIKELETTHSRREPWLSEAFILHRALGTSGITPLINGQDVLTRNDGLDLGLDMPTDVAMYRAGVRLPLSLACRVALKLGLPDPAYLYQPDPLLLQVWDVIERNERGAEPGCCPWCLADRAAGHPHRETCLPANMWAPADPYARPIGPLPKPEIMGKRMSGGGHGKGLRTMRERAGVTQKKLADGVGLNSYYYSRVERCESNLTVKNAEAIALLLKCEVSDLYHAHTEAQA